MKTLGQIIEEWGYYTEKTYFIGIVKQWLEQKRKIIDSKPSRLYCRDGAVEKQLIDELIKELV